MKEDAYGVPHNHCSGPLSWTMAQWYCILLDFEYITYIEHGFNSFDQKYLKMLSAWTKQKYCMYECI